MEKRDLDAEAIMSGTVVKEDTIANRKVISKYIRDFESLFVPLEEEVLRIKAQNGQLRHCQFRSLCWRYFLRCLPECYSSWLESSDLKRREYEIVKCRHLNSIKPQIVNDDKKCDQDNDTKRIIEQRCRDEIKNLDDLSSGDKEMRKTSDKISVSEKTTNKNDEDNDCIKLFDSCDYKNIYRTIERDVVRTFPDMEFFRQTEVQGILSNILYVFANEHTHLSYKQGMHELLATLLYVAHTDSQNCLINYQGDYANETIATLLSVKYLEHDVYYLFTNLMKSIESWYQNDEILVVAETVNNEPKNRNDSPNAIKPLNQTSKLTSSKTQVNSVLGIKLKMISDNIVKSYDPELFNHLEALQIAPQIYGIRWMRLLFGREFEFLDLLTVWDAIICDQDSMSLVDYVFASMLITIREEIVNGDYTQCLNNLMRYQFKDVPYVVKLALHLRDPSKYSRPEICCQKTGVFGSSSSQRTSHRISTSSASSLTSKLSQQYITDKLHQPLSLSNSRNHSVLNPASTKRYVSSSSSRFNELPSKHALSRQHLTTLNRSDTISSVAQAGIGYITQQASRNISNAKDSAKNKLLPNINKFVSSIGQNIQDKTNQPMHRTNSNQEVGRQVTRAKPHQMGKDHQPSLGSTSSRVQYQQPYNTGKSDIILSAGRQIIKEYEMREMQSSSSSTSNRVLRDDQLPAEKFNSGSPRNAFDVSVDSSDDLISIVDYCWRLLSEQIDSLQRCLPKEKGLHSEDEIFVALAQLKKVRDVLKGSLKLEDELESASSMAGLNKN